MSANFGNAVAAKIPKITMTMISSINVKPVCFLNFMFCLAMEVELICKEGTRI